MTIQETKNLFSKTLLEESHVNQAEINNLRFNAILEQNYMSIKGLDDDLFKMLSEKAFKEAEEVTYELIEEDNENIYL